MPKVLKIATRKSPLALWQANFVAEKLQSLHKGLQVELIPLSTKGDEILDKSLSKIGGKGLFIKELEISLRNEEADLAVHSMKDVPAIVPEGFEIAAVLQRGNPYDAFVSNEFNALEELPKGSIVGTSSLRRQCQLLRFYPHLVIKPLRGNLGTRLKKLDSKEYSAIVLAAAGLERLGLHSRIRSIIESDICLPAVAQGVLGIEIRKGDELTRDLVSHLIDEHTMLEVSAERACNERLGGGCDTAVGVFAQLSRKKTIHLRALVGSDDGKEVIYADKIGDVAHARQLGIDIADELINKGAGKYL